MPFRTTILAAALLASTAAFAQDEMLTSDKCPQFFAGGKIPVSPNFDSKILCNAGYAVSMFFAHGKMIPEWSAEHLTPALVEAAEKTPRTGSFHDEKRVPQKFRVHSDDYTDSRYDRGHLAPAGDFGDVESQKETFSMANVVPQDPNFNRYGWREIEEKVREIAKKYPDTYVVTGVWYGRPGKWDFTESKIPIPKKIWKSVYVPGHIQGAYVATNEPYYLCRIENTMTSPSEEHFMSFPDIVDVKFKDDKSTREEDTRRMHDAYDLELPPATPYSFYEEQGSFGCK